MRHTILYVLEPGVKDSDDSPVTEGLQTLMNCHNTGNAIQVTHVYIHYMSSYYTLTLCDLKFCLEL